MRLKTTLAAIVLATVPAMGFAAGCNWNQTPASTATICEEGQSYDATTGTCVTQATS